MERAAVGGNAGNIDARVLKLYQRVYIRATNGTVQRNATYPDHQQRDRAGCVVIKVDHFVFSWLFDFHPTSPVAAQITHFIKNGELSHLASNLSHLYFAAFSLAFRHSNTACAPPFRPHPLAFPFPPAAK